jgi:hypothetical protein
MIKNQGINILLNIYFGPIVNAARAIATQVDSAVLSFAHNFITAVRPQIVKSYASGNTPQMLTLVFRTTKMTFFLLFCFILPLQLELPFVLKLWLKQIPEYVLVFTRIMLVNALIDSVSYPLMGASQATGKIKLYQAVVGGISILNLPIALFVLYLGFSAVSVQVIGVILSLFAFFARIIILSRQLQFSLWQYIKKALIPIGLVFIAGSILPIAFVSIYPMKLMRMFFSTGISILSIGITVFIFGLSQNEKEFIKNKIKILFRIF